MIHGVGIEIVSVEKFERAARRWGRRLLDRLFTPGELSYCMDRRVPERHLAARFAAKLSLFKALGRPLPYRDVEIDVTEKGRPIVRLKRKESALSILVSISHDGGFALAETIVMERREAR